MDVTALAAMLDHEVTLGMEAMLRTTEGAQALDDHGDTIPALNGPLLTYLVVREKQTNLFSLGLL